ncbi:hypothetical protein B0J11DRAFT_457129 [Dendryphion nanum]|uniref:Uncharacterized protein n=1 Tax=Dendryphion nanum TaxID=256645 RepID=A0A9P9E3S3_9PLEO|nr:hypothetical protein B0J11DRAFT_457129 [Dendryphion nanum]
MRSFAALGLPIAFAAIASAGSASVGNEWSYTPDKTADWYKQHGEELPHHAQVLTTVEEGKSYIVKLPCLGCPLQERHTDGNVVEVPTEWSLNNGLLLNFTVDNSYPAILLNGDPIVPLAERPPNVQAFQVLGNTSADTMNNIVSSHMLDASWKVGTKYARFELQYQHTLLGTENPNEKWLQFDVTGIVMRSPQNLVYHLDKISQMIVQFQFAQETHEDQTTTVSITNFELPRRKSRRTPIKMKCGKFAMIQTNYNPLEWDYYGRIGTWPRTFAKMSSKTFHFIESNAFVLVALVAVFGLYKFVVTWRIVAQRRAEAAMIKDQQDVEFALLTSPDFDDDEEYDAPPDYDDVPAAEARKEDLV